MNDVQDATGVLMATAARRYVGTPFVHQGRLPGVGLDCAGVVVCAAREAGVQVDDRTDYRRQVDGADLLAAIVGHCRQVDGEVRLGDVALLHARMTRPPQHLCMLVGPEWEVVEAQAVSRVVVLRRLTPADLRRVHSVWRLAP